MSTAVLSSEYSLCDINLEESSCLIFSETRLTWLKFCEESAIPVPESNLIMITISSALYHFLLDCVVLQVVLPQVMATGRRQCVLSLQWRSNI